MLAKHASPLLMLCWKSSLLWLPIQFAEIQFFSFSLSLSLWQKIINKTGRHYVVSKGAKRMLSVRQWSNPKKCLHSCCVQFICWYFQKKALASLTSYRYHLDSLPVDVLFPYTFSRCIFVDFLFYVLFTSCFMYNDATNIRTFLMDK